MSEKEGEREAELRLRWPASKSGALVMVALSQLDVLL